MKHNDRFYRYFENVLEVSINKICKDIPIVDPDSCIDSPKSVFYSVYHYINFQQRKLWFEKFYKILFFIFTRSHGLIAYRT